MNNFDSDQRNDGQHSLCNGFCLSSVNKILNIGPVCLQNELINDLTMCLHAQLFKGAFRLSQLTCCFRSFITTHLSHNCKCAKPLFEPGGGGQHGNRVLSAWLTVHFLAMRLI